MGSRMSYFRHPECDIMGGAGSKRSRLSDEAERMKVRETAVGCFAGVRGDFFKNTRCVGKQSCVSVVRGPRRRQLAHSGWII